jgi:hypothetical protein
MVSSHDTLDACERIFPGFKAYWEDGHSILWDDGSFTTCGVFLVLGWFISAHYQSFTPDQWRALGALAKAYFDMGEPIRGSEVGACLIESLELEPFSHLVAAYFDPDLLRHFYFQIE